MPSDRHLACALALTLLAAGCTMRKIGNQSTPDFKRTSTQHAFTVLTPQPVRLGGALVRLREVSASETRTALGREGWQVRFAVEVTNDGAQPFWLNDFPPQILCEPARTWGCSGIFPNRETQNWQERGSLDYGLPPKATGRVFFAASCGGDITGPCTFKLGPAQLKAQRR